MKRLVSILTAVSAALLPLAAAAQTTPAADRPEPTYKYEVSAGYGYTGLNQVNQSRYGLQGVDLAVNRYFGKYFALTAQGDYYKTALNTGGGINAGNPGDPSVYSALGGPVFRLPLFTRWDAFAKVLLGAEHTGGEAMNPSTSVAGGFGGGLTYKLSQRFSVRASGERIGGSFSFINNTSNNASNSTSLGNSGHFTWNPRAALSVVYRF